MNYDEKMKSTVAPELVVRLVAAGMLAERGDMLQAAILFCLGLEIQPNEDHIQFASECLEISKTKLQQERDHE